MATALINGVNYSWANINLIMPGGLITGITRIEWAENQNKANNYGWGAFPVSRGYGNVEYPPATLELYQEEIIRLRALSPTGTLNGIPPFSVTVQFGNGPVQANKNTLLFAEFVTDGLTAGQGDTRLTQSVQLIFGGVE